MNTNTHSRCLPAQSEAARLRRMLKRRTIKVDISEAQYSYLKQLCGDKVSHESMATTAFCRGLQTIGDEVGIDWNPALFEKEAVGS